MIATLDNDQDLAMQNVDQAERVDENMLMSCFSWSDGCEPGRPGPGHPGDGHQPERGGGLHQTRRPRSLCHRCARLPRKQTEPPQLPQAQQPGAAGEGGTHTPSPAPTQPWVERSVYCWSAFVT